MGDAARNHLNPIACLCALFCMEGDRSQETQEVTQGQPINVKDRIITPIPWSFSALKTWQWQWFLIIWQVNLTKQIYWLHELEMEWLPCGPLITYVQAWPSQFPIHISLGVSIESLFSKTWASWTKNRHKAERGAAPVLEYPYCQVIFKLILFHFPALLHTHTHPSPI